MHSLRRTATNISTTEYQLPSGAVVKLATWTVNFPPAKPDRLPDDSLKQTYRRKPLVDVAGESLFGELAIVRWLQKDGWSALWVDTIHGRKFWNGMPHKSGPVDPPRPIRAIYDRIAELNGGSFSGCPDVVAWREKRVIWLEYKGPGDRQNVNEVHWIQAALSARIQPADILFVGVARS
jgi:hypothetical protein